MIFHLRKPSLLIHLKLLSCRVYMFFVFYLTAEIEKLNEPKLLDFLAVSSTSSMEKKTRDNDFVPDGYHNLYSLLDISPGPIMGSRLDFWRYALPSLIDVFGIHIRRLYYRSEDTESLVTTSSSLLRAPEHPTKPPLNASNE